MEILKCGTEIVIEWMRRMCSLAWERGSVPEDWKTEIIVPLYKGKMERGVCRNYRGICLLSVVGKVFSKIVIDRGRLRTEKWVGEEQGGFRKGRGCIDQIFTMRCIVEMYLEKGQKLYAAIMDLETK